MARQYRDPSGWDRLSPAQRHRYQEQGLTRSRYATTKRLARYRGHARTPERPERAIRYPRRYPEYVAKQAAASRRGFRPAQAVLPPGEFVQPAPAGVGIPPLEHGQTVTEAMVNAQQNADGTRTTRIQVTDWETGEQHWVRRRLTPAELDILQRWLVSMGYPRLAYEYTELAA